MTGSLDILRQAENEARQILEDARRKAASVRAGIKDETASLREELVRRVASEAGKRNSAVQGAVAGERDRLMKEAESAVAALRMREDEISGRAYEILSGRLTGRE
ncbi:MAG: hypothetical protein QUS11_08050 [Candidatus Fermentibacter sp.]|nr:hypothetical protein [Candidatus Fermentibacter sp.]